MHRSFLLLAVTSMGCQLAPDAPPAPPAAAVESESTEVFRGQGPMAVSGSPWGPSYLAPGELSCDTPPPFGLGYEVGPPIGAFGPPMVMVPGAPAPKAPQSATAEPGWFDVLPPEGGPISDDFGLPQQPRIDNPLPNPLYVRASNPDAAWETVAREASRYFPIRSEERIRQSGTMLSEGRLETQWASGSTIFEPWRRDSAGGFNRWQSTLQTIRRRAIVRVMPAAGGYELDVRVEKQLEDLNRPELASAGAASIRNDSALPTDRVTPVDAITGPGRWIDIGRDEALEQRMLGRLSQQFGAGR
ncbi:hypothetical protein Pla108_09580 [Botrimarina colliarenosi]|uniref:Uncharacterized protein n=1 Tax=Botrimarina colliarenosi TaxID=2528001 RepID=A0A5C6AJ15_9BACT|nr:hypothetical protein [Botrimarina colliarenosi]TWU00015.1 hypothetical protein Pla108_09580 [Botrimarina colliarenosi]